MTITGVARSGPAVTNRAAAVAGGSSVAWLLSRTFPFWLLLLYGSFIPATMNPWFQIKDVPVDSYDLLMAITAVFYILLFLKSPLEAPPVAWNRYLPLCSAVIIGYAALSFLWNGLEDLERRGMAMNLMIAAAALALSYLVVLCVPVESIESFLFLMAGFLSVVGLVYSAESFLGLNLRTELGRSYSVGFGIDRVHGPLFAASRGHMILLPAIAYILQSLIVERNRRFLKSLMLLILLVTYLGTGSRAALALLCCFGVMLCWAGRRRISGILVFFGIVALSIGFVLSMASGGRLLSSDSSRATTYITAWETLRGRDLPLNVFGSGYGSIWHYYVEDVTLGDKIARGWFMRWTDYGMTLYNSHSLPLLLVVELGLAGLLYLGKLLLDLGNLLFTGLKNGSTGVFACGVAVASVSMLAEIILFKDPKTSAIWLIFLFAALKLRGLGRVSPQAEDRCDAGG